MLLHKCRAVEVDNFVNHIHSIPYLIHYFFYRVQEDNSLLLTDQYNSNISSSMRNKVTTTLTISTTLAICDSLSENWPSSHLPVFREIPF